MKSYNVIILLPLLLLSLLQGCGGGAGGGSVVAGVDGTGRPTNARAVTAIGTIVRTDDINGSNLLVNGVNYDSTQARITIDGQVANVDGLASGQVITVTGTLDDDGESGTATTVNYNTSVFGAVDVVDRDKRTLSILGQTINVTKNTVYGSDIATFANITEGDQLRISGFLLASGHLVATYIARDNTVPGQGVDLEVSGFINNLTEQTLQINNLIVDYSNIDERLDLENGMTVEVLGELGADMEQFVANKITTLLLTVEEPNSIVEIEGIATYPGVGNEFELNDIRVRVDSDTVYQNGVLQSLSTNRRVEVEGSLSSEGILIADRVIFINARLTSHVANEVLASDTETFTWSDVKADEYHIIVYAGESTTLHNQFYSGDITSITLDDLPINGSHIQFIIRARYGNIWTYQHHALISQSILSNAELISPINNTVLTSNSMRLVWSDVGADKYGITVSSGGSSNILHQQEYDGNTTAITLENLPVNGAPLTVTIATRHGGGEAYKHYRFTSQRLLRNATLISHMNNETLASDSGIFTWEDVGADEYRVYLFSRYRISSNSGGSLEVHNQDYQGDTTSITLNDLPINGAPLTFILSTRHGNGWFNRNYNFFSQKILSNADLISHVNNEVLTSDRETFSWTDVDADEYIISLTSDNVVIHRDNYDGDTTSAPVNNLPTNGDHLELVVSTRHGKGWVSKRYNLQSFLAD